MNLLHKATIFVENIFFSERKNVILDFLLNNISAMNVSSPIYSPRGTIAMLLLGLFAFVGHAQTSSGYQKLSTAKNVAVLDTLSGSGLNVYLASPAPKHGTFSKTHIAGSNHAWSLKYTPDAGFVGVDTLVVEMNYGGSYPFLLYKGYKIQVFNSLVTVNNDFASTAQNTPVTVDVLANDQSTGGTLAVTSIPLTNAGSAQINGNGTVTFTPTPGFHGIAHFNYTACDGINSCKTGAVDIVVTNGAFPVSDTLRLATAKNLSYSLPLTFSGWTVYTPPSNGTCSLQNGYLFHYAPALNFTGSDEMVLSNTNYGAPVYKTLQFNVLNTPSANLMAMDDYVSTPKNIAIALNVKDNDIISGGSAMEVTNWYAPLSYMGTISGSSNGNVTFTPAANFTGVASFKYRLAQKNNSAHPGEIATVNVIVGNQAPSQATFDLTTPLETPIIVNYQIPFIGFDFAILDAPNNGTCMIFPGYTTQTINGVAISGNNLLVYTPNSGYQGFDEFEINYCVTATGQCQTAKVHVNIAEIISSFGPYCIDDCVWAGDVNSDGIVNNKDILPIGYFMGTDGDTRPNASLEWYGQYADNWNNPYSGLPFDLKHADTDGDGLISTADTASVSNFYNQTHTITPTVVPVGKGLPFFLTLLTPPNPGVGDLVEIEVSLGNASLPVTNIYGFTYDVTLSPLIVDSAFHMDFYPNSWLNLNSTYLGFDKSPRTGRLETAFVKTNGLPANGFGNIGKLNFIVTDIIEGGKINPTGSAIRVTLDGVQAIQADGSIASFEGTQLDIPIQIDNNSRKAVADSDLRLFPSPASELVNFHLNGDNTIENLTILNAIGASVYQSGDVQWRHAEISVRDLPNGIYFAKTKTTQGVVTKKFEVMR